MNAFGNYFETIMNSENFTWIPFKLIPRNFSRRGICHRGEVSIIIILKKTLIIFQVFSAKVELWNRVKYSKLSTRST